MQNTNENFSFKKYAWAQFKKNKIALVCLYLLFALVILAVFAPYIANERPLYAEYEEVAEIVKRVCYPDWNFNKFLILVLLNPSSLDSLTFITPLLHHL